MEKALFNALRLADSNSDDPDENMPLYADQIDFENVDSILEGLKHQNPIDILKHLFEFFIKLSI